MKSLVVIAALAGVLATATTAVAQMPDPKAMSGRPLPTTEVPPGSLTVRVVRGGFDQNVPDQVIDVDVDGQARSVTTGADGRALISGLRTGSTVRLRTVVDGQVLESQPIPMGTTGVIVALVATVPEDPAAAAAAASAAAAPAVKGEVVLGPESRVIVELAENGLTVFYVLEIVNAAATPVDVGGPIIFDLPREARGAAMLQGSTTQATANGPRVIVTGPFAPGSTVAQVAYELPYRGPTARLEQAFPITLQQLTLIVEQHGAMEIASPQVASRNMVTNEGQPLIFASGPAIAAGQALTVDFAGLPHHPTWPQWTAMSIALALIGWGIWGAATAPRRRP